MTRLLHSARSAGQAMVAADPQHRPAVVVGFSLGCRIAKYFLHFCHAKRGESWMSTHIQEFVALGGPFLGAVALMQAVMVVTTALAYSPDSTWLGQDGTFPPLDALFSQSQMLTILRSVPVGRYLQVHARWQCGLIGCGQPTGDWRDGLDMPFLFIREQSYLQIMLGAVEPSGEPGTRDLSADSRLWVRYLDHKVWFKQGLEFYHKAPYAESVTFAVTHTDALRSIPLKIGLETSSNFLLEHGTTLAAAEYAHPFGFDDGQSTAEQDVVLQLKDPSSSKVVAAVQLRICLTSSDALSQWDSKVLPRANHPLAQHNGGQHTDQSRCRLSGPRRQYSWSPGRARALHQFEGIFQQPEASWKVPAPAGKFVDDSAAPPVSRVTCIYGVNQPTVRALFLKHRAVYCRGGLQGSLTAAFELDQEGDVDGLVAIDGLAYETSSVAQFQPDTGEKVYLSGDGTVPYHSLRFASTWSGESCRVSTFELPDCDHRGVSSDPRMLKLLRTVLKLGDPDELDEIITNVEEDTQGAHGKKGDTARFVSDRMICGWVAKTGPRAFSVHRERFSYAVNGLAALSLLIGVFILIYGTAESYDFVSTCRWHRLALAPALTRFFVTAGVLELYNVNGAHMWDVAFNSSQIQVDLGILTYSHTGVQITEDTRYIQSGDVAFYTDAACTNVFADVGKLILNYGKAGDLAFIVYAQADAMFAFRANCHSKGFTIQTIPRTATGDGADGYIDYNGTFTDGCNPVTYIHEVTGKAVSMGFRLTCGSVLRDLAATGWYSPRVFTFTGNDLVTVSNEDGLYQGATPVLVPSTSTYPSNVWGMIGIADGGSYLFSDGTFTYGFSSITCSTTGQLTVLGLDGNFIADGTSSTAYQNNGAAGGGLDFFFECREQGTSEECPSPWFDRYGDCWFFRNAWDEPLPTGQFPDCVFDYKGCKEIGPELLAVRDAAGYWKKHSPFCNKGLEAAMCESCYEAGVETFVVTGVTLLIQVPLVWLTRLRTSAALDGRIRKFMVIPCALIVLVGTAVTYNRWYDQCYSKLAPLLETLISRSIGTADTVTGGVDLWGWEVSHKTHAWSFLPIISCAMTLGVLVINMIIPVPEPYDQQCVDPENIDSRLNSMPGWDECAGDSDSELYHRAVSLADLEHLDIRTRNPPS